MATQALSEWAWYTNKFPRAVPTPSAEDDKCAWTAVAWMTPVMKSAKNRIRLSRRSYRVSCSHSNGFGRRVRRSLLYFCLFFRTSAASARSFKVTDSGKKQSINYTCSVYTWPLINRSIDRRGHASTTQSLVIACVHPRTHVPRIPCLSLCTWSSREFFVN